MNFYLKQMVFTIGDRFTIYDEEGNDRYYVEGEVFTFGKKLHLLDLDGKELAFISQKIFTWLPKYEIYQGESMIAEVVKEFSFFLDFKMPSQEPQIQKKSVRRAMLLYATRSWKGVNQELQA